MARARPDTRAIQIAAGYARAGCSSGMVLMKLVRGLPDRTVRNMVMFMDKQRHARAGLAGVRSLHTARRLRHRGPPYRGLY
jgi:hypothetical protein